MKKRQLLWRVFSSYLLVIGLLVVSSLILFRYFLMENALERERARLTGAARLGAQRVTVALEASAEPLDSVFGDMSAESPEILLRLFDPKGSVLAESDGEPSRTVRPTPEVSVVMQSGEESWRLYPAEPVETQMLSVSVPVAMADGRTGVVQARRLTRPIREAVSQKWVALLTPVGLTAAAAALAAFLFSLRFTRPIEILRRGAERFGRGNLKRKVATPAGLELGELADALNRMATQLDERIDEITHQRNERQAILESMAEGLLAVDDHERVLSINRAAQDLLGISVREVVGRLVQEVCRNVSLQRLISRALDGDFSTETEEGTFIRTGTETLLRARCAPLRDGEGQDIGVVVILTNITMLQKLENLRREFVANVSHELRTPITSIKGFTETLLDGAIEDPGEARRFVEIIARQSDRLCDVIEDLLSLSRLDRHERIETQVVSLQRLIEQSTELCREQATQQSVELTIRCPEGLKLRANPVLVEQALTNLIDNAIKYSGPGKKVGVNVEPNGTKVRIHVQDNGSGIDEEHLERIFERFYRVDKARSREVGGTGLGLSIVKNVAQVHGGSVSVVSTPGEGSDFSITLPLDPDLVGDPDSHNNQVVADGAVHGSE